MTMYPLYYECQLMKGEVLSSISIRYHKDYYVESYLKKNFIEKNVTIPNYFVLNDYSLTSLEFDGCKIMENDTITDGNCDEELSVGFCVLKANMEATMYGSIKKGDLFLYGSKMDLEIRYEYNQDFFVARLDIYLILKK